MTYQAKAKSPYAGIWVKMVTKVLKNASIPQSTYSLMEKVNQEIIASRYLRISDRSRYMPQPPDSMLEWMAKQGIIQKVSFSNRKSDYWESKQRLVSSSLSMDDQKYDRPREDCP